MGVMRLRQLSLGVTSLILGTILVGCSSGGGNARSLLQVAATGTPAPDYANLAPPLTGCTPLPETAGAQTSSLKFAGPCAFTETAAVQCVHVAEDFYMYVKRQLPDSGAVYTVVNVEHYKGPGSYPKGAQIYLQVTSNGTLYEWRNDHASVTLDGGDHGTMAMKNVSLPAVAGGAARQGAGMNGTASCQ